MSKFEQYLMEQDIVNYKGMRICPNLKSVHHKSKVSGHEWSTKEDAKGFHIIGHKVDSRTNYSTVDKAKEYIDFLTKFELDKQ